MMRGVDSMGELYAWKQEMRMEAAERISKAVAKRNSKAYHVDRETGDTWPCMESWRGLEEKGVKKQQQEEVSAVAVAAQEWVQGGRQAKGESRGRNTTNRKGPARVR